MKKRTPDSAGIPFNINRVPMGDSRTLRFDLGTGRFQGWGRRYNPQEFTFPSYIKDIYSIQKRKSFDSIIGTTPRRFTMKSASHRQANSFVVIFPGVW